MFLSVLRIKIKIFLITIQYFAYSGLDPDPVYFVYFVVFFGNFKNQGKPSMNLKHQRI